MPGTCYNKSEKAAAWETNVAIQQCCCNCCQSFTWQQQNNCYSWSFFEAWNFTLFVCLCFFFFNVSNRIFYLFLNKCSSDEINGTSILSVLIIVIINHELSIFQCVLGKEVTCGNFSCYWRVLCLFWKLIYKGKLYFLFFPQMIAFPKLRKMLFISSKKLFLFSRYSDLCNIFLSILSRFKWISKSGIIYDVMNLLV